MDLEYIGGRITKELKEKFKKACAKENRSLIKQLTHLIEKFVAEEV